jgi:hypothetical protein
MFPSQAADVFANLGKFVPEGLDRHESLIAIIASLPDLTSAAAVDNILQAVSAQVTGNFSRHGNPIRSSAKLESPGADLKNRPDGRVSHYVTV